MAVKENPKLAYNQSINQVIKDLQSSELGLTHKEAKARLKEWGLNQLPKTQTPKIISIFFRQFLDPLISILLIITLISFILGHVSDALFILCVLALNALIGTVQEHSAERSAASLQEMTTRKALVQREGENFEINSEELVPGDIVHLESGQRVPADLRLIFTQELLIDESLLTGESQTITKNHKDLLTQDIPLGDQVNMAFAGTLVSKGRGSGIVVTTGIRTELGKIADVVIRRVETKTPLILRMEVFSRQLAIFFLFFMILIAVALVYRGHSLMEVLMLSVALAVATIPEGLPVAMTVALAVASKKMARRHVIVRKLSAVEALGSCSYIGTDKTGTLTLNELTAKRLVFPGLNPIEITGEGIIPEGEIIFSKTGSKVGNEILLARICESVVLCNDAFLGKRNNSWSSHGDAVDVALLVMSHKYGLTKPKVDSEFLKIAEIPFESENLFAATLHQEKNCQQHFILSVKGALERILPMCSTQISSTLKDKKDKSDVDEEVIKNQANNLAKEGYRVLAVAGKRFSDQGDLEKIKKSIDKNLLSDLEFLGLVGMIDPLRQDAKTSIEASQKAGLTISMITGDHPITALTIARELGLAKTQEEVVTGTILREANSQKDFDQLVQQGRVFARVSPQQKLEIVQSVKKQGHFVAVTGDGANDAPALKAAHVGVAMGKMGTDVARETADLIITDDRFSSLVAGIEEGRIAYANIRKVIYLLLSTGAAELVLFIGCLFTGLPMPLTAVQLLWLNVVTEGIQSAALAFEPAEGGELNRPPYSFKESVFNQTMLLRVVLSALVMGIVALMVFKGLLNDGIPYDMAKNHLLLLMVLFENVMIGNARSESKSAFRLNPLNNPFLLIGTVGAQLLHIWAMNNSFFGDLLGVAPIGIHDWAKYLLLALSVFLVMELQKAFQYLFHKRSK